MWTLKVISGPAQGRTLPVESPVIIGREEAELTIGDSELSRRHLLVSPSEQGLVVADLGSTNGTFVRGQRLSSPIELTAGDTIRIGSTEIAIERELGPRDVTRVSPAFQAPVEADEAPPGGEGSRRKRRPPLVPILLVAVLAAAATGAVLLLTGESPEERRLEGVVFVAPIGISGAKVTLAGVVQGKPIGRMSLIVVRQLQANPLPGGRAVPMRLSLLFTQPGGSFTGALVGTVRVTRKGVEMARGRAVVSNGRGTFEDIEGSFTVVGNNPPSPVSRLTVQGTLEY